MLTDIKLASCGSVVIRNFYLDVNFLQSWRFGYFVIVIQNYIYFQASKDFSHCVMYLIVETSVKD